MSVEHRPGCGVNCQCGYESPPCRTCNCGADEARRVAAITAKWIKPPAFRPDPELIDHLEGNERTIRRYRRAAQRQIGEAMTTTGCPVCGGFDYRHDPIVHGAEPTEEALEWATARTLHSTITGHNEWADGECVACGWDGP